MLPLVLLLACSTVDAPALPDEAPSIPMTVKPDASRLAIATSPDRGERVRAKVVAGTTPTEAMIQRFDPVGVAARDLVECLCVQLAHLGQEGTVAETIVRCHMDKLQNRRYKAAYHFSERGVSGAKGLFVLEAMASGVPVVQPRHGAFPELIEATGGGVLVDPDSPESLAGELYGLMHDPARRTALGRTGREAVNRSFTDDVMARETLKLYESLLGGEDDARVHHAAQDRVR